MHRCKYGRVIPATRTKFWQDKRKGNVERDKRNLRKLCKDGWKILIIWECKTKNLKILSSKLSNFLKA
jgi:DNA mismatch endonuclease (patch repair protein)